MKGLGVKAGVPDLVILRAGRAFLLELKADEGRLSDRQRDAHAAIERSGAVVGTAKGVDEALTWLEAHELLRGASVKRSI